VRISRQPSQSFMPPSYTPGTRSEAPTKVPSTQHELPMRSFSKLSPATCTCSMEVEHAGGDVALTELASSVVPDHSNPDAKDVRALEHAGFADVPEEDFDDSPLTGEDPSVLPE